MRLDAIGCQEFNRMQSHAIACRSHYAIVCDCYNQSRIIACNRMQSQYWEPSLTGGGVLHFFRWYQFAMMAFPKRVPISIKYFPSPYPFPGNKIKTRIFQLRDVPRGDVPVLRHRVLKRNFFPPKVFDKEIKNYLDNKFHSEYNNKIKN